jgi:hypothetical protein
MTQTYFLSLAISALRWYLGTGASARIISLVNRLMSDADKTGAEKRALVVKFALDELNLIGKEFVVKAMIELTLAS